MQAMTESEDSAATDAQRGKNLQEHKQPHGLNNPSLP
jgi:hypothetical protein